MANQLSNLTNKYDNLIIGSGIAGLNLARKLAQAGQTVFIVSKEAVTEGSSKYAQGGVAVYTPLNTEDKLETHIKDTLRSAKGLCDEAVVKKILEAGWPKLEEFIKFGVNFDKDFNIEGSHSYKRVMHVGDATGRAMLKPLLDKVSCNHNIFISQGTECLSLISNPTKVLGARFRTVSEQEFDIFAHNTILATGGLCGLYKDFTCPEILTGDGIVFAYDAGAKIENLEFVQFHPTVFKTKDKKRPNFLISEAVRGAGAVLRNVDKELFANKYHPEAELATRDIVSRAIIQEMRATQANHVYLDFTKLSKSLVQKDFPTIYHTCLENGYDICVDLLPVSPMAHYSIGGIKTDINGRTNIANLYAVGECASIGLHGANRLASNSLLECVVVSNFVADDILSQNSEDAIKEIKYCSDYIIPRSFAEKEKYKQVLEELRAIMSEHLGIERKRSGIKTAIDLLSKFDNYKEVTVAILLAKSALLRNETRGAHVRTDFPNASQAFSKSTILSKSRVIVPRLSSV